MAIHDNFGLLSNGQTVTTTAVSTNSIDLSSNDAAKVRDAGRGRLVVVRFRMTEAFSGGTNMAMQVVISANSNLSSFTTLASTQYIVPGNLTLGAMFHLPIPSIPHSLISGANGLRYLGANYDVVGTMSTGKIEAVLTLDTASIPRSYPVGYSGP